MPDRILGANYITVSGQRQFQNQNLGGGIAGTTMDAVWFNGVQEAIMRPTEKSGQTLNSTDFDQFTQALITFASGNVTTVSASGALTVAEAGVIVVNASSGNVTLTLPTAAAMNAIGGKFEFLRTDTTTNTVAFALQSGNSWMTTAPGNLLPLQLLRMIGAPSNEWLPLSGSPHGAAAFTSSGTFIPTTPTIYFSGVGGGGGGATGWNDGTYMYGGGAGIMGVSRIKTPLTVVPGTSYTVTIGAAGAGGSGLSGPGGAGGATSFGSLLTLSGGAGGLAGGASAGNFGVGGPPTDNSQGSEAAQGGVAPASLASSGMNLPGGTGLSSPFGGYGSGGNGGWADGSSFTMSATPGAPASQWWSGEMIATAGHTYAQIVNGTIFWIFTAAQLPQWADGQITVADVTGISPAPAAGWTATNTAGNWSFAAPAAPAAPSLAQQALTAINAGLALTSTGSSTLNATYALDPESRSDMQAEMISLLINSTFANGTTTQPWPDVTGAMHTFNVTQFKAFAVAAGAYVSALKQIIRTNSGSLPSASVTIA